jgi:hypothetical protein
MHVRQAPQWQATTQPQSRASKGRRAGAQRSRAHPGSGMRQLGSIPLLHPPSGWRLAESSNQSFLDLCLLRKGLGEDWAPQIQPQQGWAGTQVLWWTQGTDLTLSASGSLLMKGG